jgi:hypothetical protein
LDNVYVEVIFDKVENFEKNERKRWESNVPKKEEWIFGKIKKWFN